MQKRLIQSVKDLQKLYTVMENCDDAEEVQRIADALNGLVMEIAFDGYMIQAHGNYKDHYSKETIENMKTDFAGGFEAATRIYGKDV